MIPAAKGLPDLRVAFEAREVDVALEGPSRLVFMVGPSAPRFKVAELPPELEAFYADLAALEGDRQGSR